MKIRLYLPFLKWHPYWNANQNSANAALTKNKQKIKTYTYFFLVVMSLFACTPLSPMSLFVTNFGYAPPPSPGDVFCEWLFSWILKFWWHVFLLWILSQTIMHIVIIILVWYRVSQCFSGVTNLLVKLIKMQKWKFFSCMCT